MRELHLRATELEASDLYAAAYLRRGAGPARARTWVERADVVHALVESTGRLPRQHGTPQPSAAERSAFSWLRYQRLRSVLSPFQTVRLEAIPGFALEPLEEQWRSRLLQLSDRASAGRFPSRRSHDAAERSLAAWADRQERARRKGTMPYMRRESWLAARALWADNSSTD